MDVLSHTHPTQGVLYDKDLTGDLGDRIRTISDLKSSSATTTLRWYYYNGLGERIVKTDGATNHTPFVYDAFGHLVGEYVYSSTSSASYQEHIWLGDMPIANMRNGVTSPLYVLADHLNTPRRVVFPSNNTMVWQWNGEPFGADQATGSGTYNLRFPGQYYDAETGKHYNYFRDYDPAMGRYIESDPIGLAGGLNTYEYVEANPLSKGDSMGLSSASLGWGAGWTAAGAVAAADGPLPLGELVAAGIIAQGLYEMCKDKSCPPCSPPAGTVCWTKDSGHLHKGLDPHWHTWQMNQYPDT